MPSRKTATLVAGLLVAAAALGGGAGFALSRGGDVLPVAQQEPAPLPTVAAVGLVNGAVPWDRPLTLSVTDGTLTEVTATGPDGTAVQGSLVDGQWSSAETLLPSSTYTVTATVEDRRGDRHQLDLTTRTTPPTHVLKAVVSPGDGKVVGVGLPVIVTLSRAVKEGADRRAVVARMSVSTTPVVQGSWRWMSPTELHYRGPSYWTKGTRIQTRLDFTRLELSDGTWGEGARTTDYTIGSAVVSTVDVAKKIMVVRVDGKVVRTVKVSTGRDKYPTKGGVHLVLEKTKLKVMDSATVGIPRSSPDGYYEKVPNSVRISYSGEFVHSAGWSVRDQGVRNVSHGCVNVSPADAAWFFDLVKRGDIVNVINANAKPLLSDPGMSDWNIPFASWENS